MQLRQRTISREVSVSGPGLFSGEQATLTFCPAQSDAGITFVRETEGKTATIAAHVNNVMARPRRTCLKNGTLHVETVEHCMAALAGLGVINATVRVRSEQSGECPMADGSSQPFVNALLDAGVVEQGTGVVPLEIKRPLHVEGRDGATIAALPGPKDHLEIVYEFEAPAPVGRQVFAFHLNPYATSSDSFADLLAPARTFIFESEARMLAERGIGTHLSPRDVLVIGSAGPIENQYRFTDECVRHKVLDLIGDLSLVGRPIVGRIVAHKSGHELNHLMAKKLVNQYDRDERTGLLNRDAALDIRRIQRILPHRYPMLLIDRVLEIEGDSRAVGLKNITFNDVFIQGHYPGTPIFPGVLIVEAMAQLGGILLSQKLEHTGKLAVLLSMDKVKMRHPVVPGDQLILEARAVRVKSRTGHVRCQAFVGDKLAAEADIKFMLVDAEPG
ncbi:MAG TPA: 3-hydroxyacyl-ACP dehydratase FabZ [Tepidisphaeraceae bacterium]|nr:3-hydroxyacyl-ACP dehydratase FabZ [Tepidisphaeraceae bacterium]